ncbi:uncharacterized protein BJX67DRAFT_362658 [Aspergillus lucknowensis]|uniref:Uncharacterized protein n=1 Tax=Aspergillus lucknowensis TaxID=176173 RepID=A0ABR4LH02_9EURO
MHMGMCGKLALNEGMKVVVWGTAAKYGTPEMLDALHQDGPFFSWHAYDAWLYFLADEGKNFRVYYRIRDHYRAHEEREMLKFARKGQVMDESPRNQRLPPLLDCLYQLSANNPKLELDYFIMHEATRPLHRDEQ